jgi:membrane protease YdiL (CAAX protease family)
VYDRVLQIVTIVALVAGRRWVGLTSWRSLGLGERARRRDLWIGLVVGIGGLLLLLCCMHAGGALTLGWRYPLAKGVRKTFSGVAAAALIGAGEELLFRGVLLHGFLQAVRRGAAVGWVTVVYAVVHFLRGGKQVGPVTLGSGFERVASAVAPLGDPTIVPGLVGFVLLGLVLAYARLQSGALYLPMGLHIGWVMVARVGRVVADFPRRPGLLWGQRRPPIVSGVAGWIAIGATLALLALWLRREGRRTVRDGRQRVVPDG